MNTKEPTLLDGVAMRVLNSSEDLEYPAVARVKSFRCRASTEDPGQHQITSGLARRPGRIMVVASGWDDAVSRLSSRIIEAMAEIKLNNLVSHSDFDFQIELLDKRDAVINAKIVRTSGWINLQTLQESQ